MFFETEKKIAERQQHGKVEIKGEFREFGCIFVQTGLRLRLSGTREQSSRARNHLRERVKWLKNGF